MSSAGKFLLCDWRINGGIVISWPWECNLVGVWGCWFNGDEMIDGGDKIVFSITSFFGLILFWKITCFELRPYIVSCLHSNLYLFFAMMAVRPGRLFEMRDQWLPICFWRRRRVSSSAAVYASLHTLGVRTEIYLSLHWRPFLPGMCVAIKSQREAPNLLTTDVNNSSSCCVHLILDTLTVFWLKLHTGWLNDIKIWQCDLLNGF